MKLDNFVLVPYQEYQELLKLREGKYQILKQPLFTKQKYKGGFVDELELTIRTYNVLRGMWHEDIQFQFLMDLLNKSEAELLKELHFGRKSLNSLKEELKNHAARNGLEEQFISLKNYRVERKFPEEVVADIEILRQQLWDNRNAKK